uniref:Cytochrome b561 family member A3 n=1 Tax=Myotis myotis TaxID=51298 RepID=A0A7J7RHA5_MYOMY|nr:cytochrome b561 family member A3 [Myotis myotis]
MGVGRPRRRRRGNQLLGARGEGDSGLHFPGGPARDRKCPDPLNGRRGFARLSRAVVPGACGSRCCSVSVHLGPSRTAAGWPRRASETPDSAASHRGSGLRRLSAACLLKRLARLARPPLCSLPGSKRKRKRKAQAWGLAETAPSSRGPASRGGAQGN